MACYRCRRQGIWSVDQNSFLHPQDDCAGMTNHLWWHLHRSEWTVSFWKVPSSWTRSGPWLSSAQLYWELPISLGLAARWAQIAPTICCTFDSERNVSHTKAFRNTCGCRNWFWGWPSPSDWRLCLRVAFLQVDLQNWTGIQTRLYSEFHRIHRTCFELAEMSVVIIAFKTQLTLWKLTRYSRRCTLVLGRYGNPICMLLAKYMEKAVITTRQITTQLGRRKVLISGICRWDRLQDWE